VVCPVVEFVPPPPLASSQVPMRLLPPCQTPFRSGWPSAARGTLGLAFGGPPFCPVTAKGSAASANAAARYEMNRYRMIASREQQPMEHCRHRPYRLGGQRKASFRL